MECKTDGFSVAEVVGQGVENDRASGAQGIDSNRYRCVQGMFGRSQTSKVTGARACEVSKATLGRLDCL